MKEDKLLSNLNQERDSEANEKILKKQKSKYPTV